MPRTPIKELRQEALELYVRIVRELGRVPTNAELNRGGLPVNTLKSRWGSFEQLDRAARRAHPEAFSDVRVQDVARRLPKAERYVLTTAVAGAPVHSSFLESLRRYCKLHGAQLGVMVCEDPATSWSRQGHFSIDRELADLPVIAKQGSQELNRNLKLISMKVGAKMIDPSTGVSRLAAKGQSLVLASPKQRVRPVATSGVYPQVVLTTGAVTLPNYQTTGYYLSKRTAFLADEDHVCGALVVEVEDAVRFHVRHVQAAPDGSFIDDGVRYSARVTKRVRPEAVAWGDLHIGHEDPVHREARYRLLRELRPKQQIVHDLFSGTSIDHWRRSMKISQAKAKDLLSLSVETAMVRQELRDMARLAPVVVVRSNHDEWLTRYLESGEFMHEPQNTEYALELALRMVRGEDPIISALSPAGCRVKFLQRNESHKVAGHECGYHGDQGPNGARAPGLASFEASLGPCVIGHRHTAEVLRMAKCVGTSTKLRLGYNNGPSSWSNSHIVLYEGGAWQMYTVIDGYYRAKRG